jgi:site-specific DNA-methyltransferase (adenine-specific)
VIEVIHGDCLSVLPTLADRKIAAVVTDPPYGMGWNTDSTRFSGGQVPNGRKRGDGRADWGDIKGDAEPFDPAPWLDFPKVILWGANHYATRLPVGTSLVWIKRYDDLFGSFLSDAEIGWMKGGHGVYCYRHVFQPPMRAREADARHPVHPTQKPISLMRWCLERLKLPPGSLVLDPYAGSGTTGVACLKMGLDCILIEKDARYLKTIHRRLQAAATPLFDNH